MNPNIFIVKHFKDSEEFEAFQKEDKYRVQLIHIHPDKTISITCIEQQKGLNVLLSAVDVVRQMYIKNGNMQQSTQMQILINELLSPGCKLKI